MRDIMTVPLSMQGILYAVATADSYDGVSVNRVQFQRKLTPPRDLFTLEIEVLVFGFGRRDHRIGKADGSVLVGDTTVDVRQWVDDVIRAAVEQACQRNDDDGT